MLPVRPALLAMEHLGSICDAQEAFQTGKYRTYMCMYEYLVSVLVHTVSVPVTVPVHIVCTCT